MENADVKGFNYLKLYNLTLNEQGGSKLMITAKLNLTALKHGLVAGKTEGEVLICIPVKANQLFLSEKKNVYLDIVGFDFEDKTDTKYPNTHLLKQSFSKEALAAMSEDVKKALPILGNARVNTGAERSEPAPNSVMGGDVAKGVDDLPF
jgi:hypothetical protein